jgi:phosphinothricin acetyltransferase
MLTIRSIKKSDVKAVMEVYNHYVNTSSCTFSDKPMQLGEAKELVQHGIKIAGYVICVKDKVVGFGIAYPFRAETVFSGTVKLTYFIFPNYVKKGWGKSLLEALNSKLKAKKYHTMLVNISSLNKASLAFHKNAGFTRCGLFREIGLLHNELISMIWMQKKI